ncbi:uncharacterized protein NFIA_095450 [Aspergillus fischeri NRRL 181]|uniref:DUF7702 domain-containing protein n=1 Tax=Neosartorya fischeri (strain ATCC 1020 / DSM 3700 / CBS 544.65 / FGSC A1164 / JCM 1740 / NRRL 181 / WB 181) TaxID=331117 RepID=A1DAN5_NEOFI|nr:conserved hypothetical protein [Aspergillus fischeri NRRL 181]EAW19925.1 conserved hypothetical protein [Aspergillus fischeri NRRL 181]KAG2009336.1 hypothetical protein GB937_007739 [Aspergillus fischeri]
MLTDHSKVAIAQIVFYVPAIVAAAVLLFHRHGRPRQAWIILQVFCLIRVACAIVTILYENTPTSIGLYIAALILLNAGLLPLIAATLGLLRIIIVYEFKNNNKSLHMPMRISRFLFIAGIALIIAGGSLAGDYTDAESVKTGHTLTKVGYIVVAVFMAGLVLIQGHFWRLYASLSRASQTVLKGMGLAVPFIIVRIAWLFLSIYHPDDKRWSNLSGDIGAFVVMTALMEYIIVCIYIGTGFMIPATKGVTRTGDQELEHEPAGEGSSQYGKLHSLERA